MSRLVSLALVLALVATTAHAGKVAGNGGGKVYTTQVGGNAQDGAYTGAADKGTFSYADDQIAQTDLNRLFQPRS